MSDLRGRYARVPNRSFSEPVRSGARWLSANALALGAAASLVLALHAIYFERIQAAGVAAGLFIVAMLFVYVPYLESFKAFTVEAKLRERIDQAQELLERIKYSALASARNSFVTIGIGNRMVSQSWTEKFDLLNENIQNLSSLGVSKGEITRLLEPVKQAIAYDSFSGFSNILAMKISDQTKIYSRRIDEIRKSGLVSDEDELEIEKLRAKMTEEARFHDRQRLAWKDADIPSAIDLIKRDASNELFSDRDRESLRFYIGTLIDSLMEIERDNRFEANAARVLDRLDDRSTSSDLYLEIFGSEYKGDRNG